MTYTPTLIDTLKERAKTYADNVFFRFVDYDDAKETWVFEEHTYKETYHRSLEIAYMLKKKGLKSGDRAIIFSMQDFGTVYAVYGCMMAGVVFTIIPPPIDEDKVARFISVLKSCQPKALISNYALEQTSDAKLSGRLLKEAFLDTVRLKRIYTDKLYPYRRDDVIVPVSPDQLAYLQYTSGSTKAPKGVRVLWKNLMKNIEQCRDCLSLDHVSLATWVPFFHNLGLIVTICMPVYAIESQGYFLQTMRFLENPRLWMKLMSDFNVTLTVGPHSAYDACTRIYSKEEAASLALPQTTHFMNGSEYISPKSVERFMEMFQCTPNAMAPGYGVSENCCLATFASQDYRTLKLDYAAFQNNRAVLLSEEEAAVTPYKEIVTAGAPVKDLTVLIGDAKTGDIYPDLTIGEIFLAGESVADGYWNNPEDTKNFHARLNGYDYDFYQTGDLGFLYEGHLYITGRIKEMLIVNGHNIYPSDLQVTLQRNVPALAGAAYGFFSCESDTKEQVVAVVEAKSGEDFPLRTQEINKAVSDRFGFSFHDVVFVPFDTIPRTDNRKLQMLKARTLYMEEKLDVLYSSLTSSRGGGFVAAPKADAATSTASQKASASKKAAAMQNDVIFEQVYATFQKVLQLEEFSLTDSFLLLGGDSLTGFELIHSIEETFHIKLDFRELLRDSSVTGVTAYIQSVLTGTATKRAAFRLSDECRLDESIQCPGNYEKSPAFCRKILLTGATGFLGAQLIYTIFRYYPHRNLELYCLVRAKDVDSGMQRLKENLKHYHLWNDKMERYLRPIIGNLSEPRLGLSEETWTELSEKIEVIYHNGAVLNFVYPYEFLKTTNVDSTAETIRLACTNKAKYYHFVSSYSVYDTPNNRGKHLMEDDALNSWKGFSLSYSETKWVSEKLVSIARQRGLKAAIYRPGDITGAANGIYEVNDMVSRLMVSMIQMKGIPLANYSFHMTPVDYVAKAIIYISRKEECFGHAFNLVNPKPQSLRFVARAIHKCGYPIHHIPFLVWKKRIKQADTKDNAMVLLECLFESGNERNNNVLWHFFGKESVYDQSNVERLLFGSGISCSPVDQKRIAAYLRHFIATGAIEKP